MSDEESNFRILLGKWYFDVLTGEQGEPVVRITVRDFTYLDDEGNPTETTLESEGDLADAVIAAYDAMGYVCPLVRDTDLDALK